MNAKRWMIGLIVMLALTLTACGAASHPQAEPGFAGGAPVSEVFPVEEVAGDGAYYDAVDQSGTINTGGQPQQRIVIYNASMAIVVNDVQGTVDALSQLAVELGGFVVSTNVYEGSYWDGSGYVDAPRADLTIRVPAAELEGVMADIREQSVRVESESVNGQDVTAEYTDLQSRLRSLELARDQLEEILAGANETEDVLAVYAELQRVNEEIEIVRGQINYYNEAAALSALTLSIQSNVLTRPISEPGWNPGETVQLAIRDLIRNLQSFVDLAIYTVICGSPALVVIIPLGLAGWWWWQRRQKRKADANGTPPAA